MKQEQFLQQNLVIWLEQHGVLFCASAGGMRTNIRTAVNMKRAGYRKGFPDIFIYEPRNGYYGLAIEVKAHSYSSPEQRKWQAELNQRKYKALIMPANLDYQQSVDWFKKMVCEYMGWKE